MDKKAIADIHKNTAEVVRMGAVCDAGPTRSTRATAARSRWASRYDWRRCSPMRWCPSRSEGQCGGADRHVLQPHEPIEEGTVQSRIAAITRHCPRRYSVTTIDGVRMELDDGNFGSFACAYPASFCRFSWDLSGFPTRCAGNAVGRLAPPMARIAQPDEPTADIRRQAFRSGGRS